MYLNLGADYYVLTEDIVGIFDLDTANTQTDTKEYLKDAENNAMLIYAGYELPKSFVLPVTSSQDSSIPKGSTISVYR